MIKVGVLAKHEIEYWEYLQDRAHQEFPEIFELAYKQGRSKLKQVFVHVGNLSEMKGNFKYATVVSIPKDVETKIQRDMIRFMTK